MAKGKGSSHTSSSTHLGRRRDHSFSTPLIATLRVPSFQPLPLLPTSPLERLSEVEDRRSFHFEGPNRPALMDDGTMARVHVVDRPKNRNRVKPRAFRFGPKIYSQTKAVVAFQEPERVAVCVRRKARREVLFAKKRAGRGGMRKPRRTWLSKISCRR